MDDIRISPPSPRPPSPGPSPSGAKAVESSGGTDTNGAGGNGRQMMGKFSEQQEKAKQDAYQAAKPTGDDFDTTYQKVASSPSLQLTQAAPVSRPTPLEDHEIRMLSAEKVDVTGLVAGNLPGMASLWVSQAADELAQEHDRIALVRISEEAVEIELFFAGRAGQPKRLLDLVNQPLVITDEQADEVAFANFQNLMEEMLHYVPLWVMHVNDETSQEAEQLARWVPQWTVISGGDQASAVSAYRIIKRIAKAEIDPELAFAGQERPVSMLFLGCEHEQAEETAVKIRRAASAFLTLPAQWGGWRQKMLPIQKAQVFSGTNREDQFSKAMEDYLREHILHAKEVAQQKQAQQAAVEAAQEAKSPRSITQQIDDQLNASEAELKDARQYEYENFQEPPLNDHRPKPMDDVQAKDPWEPIAFPGGEEGEMQITEGARDYANTPPKPKPQPAPKPETEPMNNEATQQLLDDIAAAPSEEPVRPTDKEEAIAPQAAKPASVSHAEHPEAFSLLNYLPNVSLLEEAPPMQPEVQLALSDNGTPVLMVSDDSFENSPHQAITELLAAGQWLTAHRGLLNKAYPSMHTTRRAQLHCFTAQPDQVLPLQALWTQAGQLVNVHLLKEETIAGSTHWIHSKIL